MTRPLKVGVLLCSHDIQLLDLAAVDLLAMMSSEYLRICGLPPHIVALGIHVQFHYIADIVAGDEAPTERILTAGVRVPITDYLDSPRIGTLDILIILGSTAPNYTPSQQTLTFIQTQAGFAVTASSSTATQPTPGFGAKAILITSSGILPTALSNILSQKRATAPLAMLPSLFARFPDVEWVTQRWCISDDEDSRFQRKIWTSGAATNSTDMMAAFIRKNFDQRLVNVVCRIADVGDRRQEYPDWQLNTNIF